MNRLLLILACGIAAVVAEARQGEIRPGELWYDTAGHVINAHGCGVLFDKGVYWWYGEHKVYGSRGNQAHVGVHVYSSTDLVNWDDRGVALAVSDDPESDIVDGCIIERPKVVFCPKTGRYSMFFHLELKGQGYKAARVGIATAERPEGPFRFLRSLRPNGAMSRDMTLFVDDDGKA
ncbi:MAG: family 43 glycosylhydrolase, partial [Kiritimatiellae bacterium]|nr:family 43 glycosylhydrolase [Kiritimatiellia bacterium]